jgi:hypothetical protein
MVERGKPAVEAILRRLKMPLLQHPFGQPHGTLGHVRSSIKARHDYIKRNTHASRRKKCNPARLHHSGCTCMVVQAIILAFSQALPP